MAVGSSLRVQVARMLARGQSVAYVVRVTGAPRQAVIKVGHDEGLVFMTGLDAFTPAPGEAAASADDLLRRGTLALSQRTRTLAARARSVLHELERSLDLDAAARARGEADPDRVRAWAAEAGIPCASRGRIPAAVLDAYREAGAP